MVNRRPSGHQPLGAGGFGKHQIHHGQNFGRRPARLDQRHKIHRAARGLCFLGEMGAHFFKPCRVSPLKTVDRLLFIADGEHGSGFGMGSITGKKLLRQSSDNLPLGRAGVLGFVHQNMLKPAVDFEQNPLGRRARIEQPVGADNQVVIIEHAKAGFCRLVSGDEVCRKAVNVARQRQRLRRAQAIAQYCDIVGLMYQRLGDGRVSARECGCYKPRTRVSFFGHENALKKRPSASMRAAAGAFGPAFQAFALRAIRFGRGLRQCLNKGCHVRQIGFGMGAQKRFDIKSPIRQIHRPGNIFKPRLYRVIGGKLVAMIENIPRQTRHGIFGDMAREPRNRGAPLRIVGIDLGTHEIGLHRARLLLVQQFELGRQAGLNREAFENGFTKSVNGLNTQPPRCFQRAGKQRSRQPQALRVRRHFKARFDFCGQFRIRHERPVRQKRKQALLHFSRCAACIGQAKKFFRCHTEKHQRHQPRYQYVGFAGTRIGTHPSRSGGLRDRPHASSPPRKLARHSSTRARWS